MKTNRTVYRLNLEDPTDRLVVALALESYAEAQYREARTLREGKTSWGSGETAQRFAQGADVRRSRAETLRAKLAPAGY